MKGEWGLEPGGWQDGDLSSSSSTHSDALPYELREPEILLGMMTVWECKPWMLKGWLKLACGNESEKTSTEMSLDQELPTGVSQKTNLLMFRQYHHMSYCLTYPLHVAQWQDLSVAYPRMVAFDWFLLVKIYFIRVMFQNSLPFHLTQGILTPVRKIRTLRPQQPDRPQGTSIYECWLYDHQHLHPFTN